MPLPLLYLDYQLNPNPEPNPNPNPDPTQVLAALESEQPPFVLLHKQLAESVRKLGVRLNYRFAATPQVRFRVRM